MRLFAQRRDLARGSNWVQREPPGALLAVPELVASQREIKVQTICMTSAKPLQPLVFSWCISGAIAS
jgi:hypothetical protein